MLEIKKISKLYSLWLKTAPFARMTKLLLMSLYKMTGRGIIIIATIDWLLAIYQALHLPGSLHKLLSILAITTKGNYYSHEKAEVKNVSTISSRSQS